MIVNRNLARMLLVPAATLGALCASPAAIAATSHPAPAPAVHQAPLAKPPAARQRVLREGMTVVGFNPAIAKAHGYKIVTYANGDEQSVPVNPRSGLPKSPILRRDRGIVPANSDYDKVIGNCGTSWIAVMQTAPGQVQVASGFTVSSSPALGYSWTVSLSDANGTSQQSASGSLWFRSAWARTWTNLNQHTYTFDYVESGLANLEDGTICYAGRPSVTISGLA
ncbi:MAG TPA: hypothetical protein VMU95_33065 [Trebonia sp.]|nr:hypothetical protein [Trebonia sp.]